MVLLLAQQEATSFGPSSARCTVLLWEVWIVWLAPCDIFSREIIPCTYIRQSRFSTQVYSYRVRSKGKRKATTFGQLLFQNCTHIVHHTSHTVLQLTDRIAPSILCLLGLPQLFLCLSTPCPIPLLKTLGLKLLGTNSSANNPATTLVQTSPLSQRNPVHNAHRTNHTLW
jgi:hypothetical protein